MTTNYPVVTTELLEKIVIFLQEKTKNSVCVSCGSPTSAIETNPAGDSLGIPVITHDGVPLIMQHMPLLVMTCQNCFCVQTHALIPILRAIGAMPPPDSDIQP